MNFCKLCKENSDFVDAHILPKSFYKSMGGMGVPIARSDAEGSIPKRRPIGAYDSKLVCSRCEKLFGDWDSHANKVLNNEVPEESYLVEGGNKYAYLIKDFDYAKLKLFFISLLWRAHSTTRDEFSKVDIGDKFCALAENMIVNSCPGLPEDFSVVITKFDHWTAGKLFLSPRRRRFFGINYYFFSLIGCDCLIKIDSRNSPGVLGELSIKPGVPILVALMDFHGSTERKIVDGIIKKNFLKRRNS